MSQEAFERAEKGGAIGFISRLIQAAVHPFVIINRIRAAYRGMNMQEVSQIYWKGAAAHTAGYEMSQSSGNQVTPLSDIPINPFAVPPSQLPNVFRAQITGAYQRPGSTGIEYRTINTYWVNNPTRDQLNQAWLSYFLGEVLKGNDTNPPQPGQIPQDMGITQFNFIERSA